jgi:hypothetical protein
MPRFRVIIDTDDALALPSAMAFLQGMGFSPKIYEQVEEPQEKPAVPVRQPATSHRQPVAEPVAFDRDAAWQTFLALAKDNPKKVLQLIKDAPNGLSAELIAEQFGEQPNWFTGVLNGGIQRNIKTAGFKLEDVLNINRSGGTVLYFPGPELKRREVS